jgi:hypothetical protein
VRARRTVELSVFPLISLIRNKNLGDPHPIFAGGERYVSPRYADEAERLLRDELTEDGLGRRDALDEFVDALTLVQRASSEYYGWMSSGEQRYATLVAGSGRRAVAVMRAGDRVTVERADADRLVEELVYRLPDVRTGAGESISVLAETFGARQAGAVLRHSKSARPEDARRLDALVREPRLGGAKLYAARRDQNGDRHRSREQLTLLDLTVGRWLVYPTLGRGERAINAMPGSPQLIATKLTELRRTAR